MLEKMLSSFQWGNIDKYLEGTIQTSNASAEDFISKIITGDFKEFFQLLKESLVSALTSNLTQCRNLFLAILFIGILAILMNAISDMFASKQVATFSNYFIFLISSLVLLKAFSIAYLDARQVMLDTYSFIKVLMPAFCMAMGMACGTITATAYYELQLFLLFVLNKILISVFLPVVQLYCMLLILDHLSDGNRFAGFLKLIKKFIVTGTKVSLFVSVVGSLIQAAILPGIDNMGAQLMTKAVSVIPGLGNFAGTFSQLFLSGAALVKNSVGILGLFIIVMICLKPVVATLMIAITIRFVTSIIELSGEKVLTSHMWKMADSFLLLARIQMFGSGLFFLSIVITNVAYYRF